MEVFKADVAIIGAGGTGLRAAIAVAEADPSLKVALLSKVYPMRSHTVAAGPVNEWPGPSVYFGGVHAVRPGVDAAGDPRRGGTTRTT